MWKAEKCATETQMEQIFSTDKFSYKKKRDIMLTRLFSNKRFFQQSVKLFYLFC